ncbi:hypothetical protein C8J57DRAFT_1474574 [Mycena rebaudengoi]|nr:hypothetical protein C8J57DRAFT_1474574 [Mycena rebaudengoi]
MRAIGSRISDEAEPFGNGQDHPHLYRRAHAAKAAGPAGWDERMNTTKVYDEGCKQAQQSPSAAQGCGREAGKCKRSGRKPLSRGGRATSSVYVVMRSFAVYYTESPVSPGSSVLKRRMEDVFEVAPRCTPSDPKSPIDASVWRLLALGVYCKRRLDYMRGAGLDGALAWLGVGRLRIGIGKGKGGGSGGGHSNHLITLVLGLDMEYKEPVHNNSENKAHPAAVLTRVWGHRSRHLRMQRRHLAMQVYPVRVRFCLIVKSRVGEGCAPGTRRQSTVCTNTTRCVERSIARRAKSGRLAVHPRVKSPQSGAASSPHPRCRLQQRSPNRAQQ